MSDAPERIWAVTEPDDVSAQIMGDVYAQQSPDGMVGVAVEYVRADRAITPEEAARVLLDADDVLDKITLMILGKKTEHTPNLDYVAQRVMKKSDWCKQVEAALRAIADGGDDE